MMRRLFSILLVLGSIVAFCDVPENDVTSGYLTCYMVPNEDGYASSVTIVCASGAIDPMPSMPSPMSETECRKIKTDMTGLLDSLESSLTMDFMQLETAFDNLDLVKQQALDLHMVWYETINPDHAEFGEGLADLYQQLIGTQANVGLVKDSVENDITMVRNYKQTIAEYVCVSNSCSQGTDSSGQTICNCQGWGDLLSNVDQIRRHTGTIAEATLSNVVMVAGIYDQVGILSDTISNIVDRLDKPDDRIWDELNSIYKNFATNMLNSTNNLVYQQINLVKLLEDFRKKTNGDINPRLSITTEGIISLYSSIFDMARTVQDQYNYRAFDHSVAYFSNTVSTLFHQFDEMIGPATIFGGHPVIATKQYPYIYTAFTNNAYAPRNRFIYLSSPGVGGVTNWFQRMELYHQAMLGWFDDLPQSDFEQEQERQTESSIEWNLDQTTNGLGQVVSEAGLLLTNVSSIVNGLVLDLKNIQIQASLPTQITLFPSFDVGQLGKFGPVIFDTTELSSCFELCRKVTTLIWRTTFWISYFVLAVLFVRLVFFIVMYVINFLKDL